MTEDIRLHLKDRRRGHLKETPYPFPYKTVIGHPITRVAEDSLLKLIQTIRYSIVEAYNINLL